MFNVVSSQLIAQKSEKVPITPSFQGWGQGIEDWGNWGKNTWNLMKSVRENPFQTDPEWHQEKLRTQNIPKGRPQHLELRPLEWHVKNLERIRQGIGHLPTLEEYKHSPPEVQKVYELLVNWIK
jgi:hypothetical protein